MSDFPMPETIPAKLSEIGSQKAVSDYAPKRGLAAVAEAVERQTLGQGGGTGYKPPLPNGEYKSPGHTAVIKDKLKQLTHREMRDLVGEIFKAAGAGTDKDTISRTEMADTLDRLAFGD